MSKDILTTRLRGYCADLDIESGKKERKATISAVVYMAAGGGCKQVGPVCLFTFALINPALLFMFPVRAFLAVGRTVCSAKPTQGTPIMEYLAPSAPMLS